MEQTSLRDAVNRMTEAQISEMLDYRKQYTNVVEAGGYDRPGDGEIRKVVDRLYKDILKLDETPGEFSFHDGPWSAGLAANAAAGIPDDADPTWAYWTGTPEMYWLGCLLYFKDYRKDVHIDEEKTRNIETLSELAKWGGSIWPWYDHCVISLPPTEIHLDEDGFPHNEAGPAVNYKNNDLTAWVIHNVMVTEKIVMRPDELTVEDITEESNEEVRRIMIERHGPGNFLDAIGAEVVDVDSHQLNNDRALLSARLPNGSEMRYLVVSDPSTGRVYHIEVRPDILTCEDADRYINEETVEEAAKYVDFGATEGQQFAATGAGLEQAAEDKHLIRQVGRT